MKTVKKRGFQTTQIHACSLRDEIALTVLPSVYQQCQRLASLGHKPWGNEPMASVIAFDAYCIADAMMAEREKTNATD